MANAWRYCGKSSTCRTQDSSGLRSALALPLLSAAILLGETLLLLLDQGKQGARGNPDCLGKKEHEINCGPILALLNLEQIDAINAGEQCQLAFAQASGCSQSGENP